MENPKVRKRESINEDATSRLKIMFVLINSEKPMKLANIWKETGLSQQLVSHHLEKLVEEYIILENEDGTYSCQPFFQDESVVENLDGLMEIIVRIVFQNIELPEDATSKDIEKAVQAVLRMYIQMFGID